MASIAPGTQNTVSSWTTTAIRMNFTGLFSAYWTKFRQVIAAARILGHPKSSKKKLKTHEGTTMNRLTVLYGHPTNPAEFDRYYHEVHIPIAKKMKGLKGWTIGKCESA